MKRSVVFIAAVTLSCFMCEVYSYEVGTHARITRLAYARSTIQDDGLLELLGLTAEENLSKHYIDIKENSITPRESDFSHTLNIMPGKNEAGEDSASVSKVDYSLTPIGWLMRGSIREDDAASFSKQLSRKTICHYESKTPEDDPYHDPDISRPLSHFYDPINGKTINIAGVTWPGSLPAPKWGTGREDPFDKDSAVALDRDNHFTLADAREAMFRALTLQSTEGSRNIVPDGEGGGKLPGNATDAENARKAYWATTFRSLGDLVHLVEDMAQPQHTRNDQHSGVCDGTIILEGLVGHASVYEKWIEARALNKKDNLLENLASYPVPRFDSIADYFSTQPTHGDTATAGRGLADYCNRGFFTAGTTPGNSEYSFPPNDTEDTSYTVVDVDIDTTKYRWNSIIKPLKAQYFQRAVQDSVMGTTSNASLVKYSRWRKYYLFDTEDYSLDQTVYEDMARLLLPRAVAYSAGVIDYFFRGRVQADNFSIDEQRTTITATVRNLSRDIAGTSSDSPVEVLGPGRFVMTASYHPPGADQDQELLISSDQVQFEGSLAPGEESSESLVFTLEEPIPADVEDVKYRLVFVGDLGNETDNAVAVGDVAETALLAWVWVTPQRATEMWRSTDLGRTWESVLSLPPAAGAYATIFPKITSTGDGTAVATIVENINSNASPRFSAYRTEDNGRTWSLWKQEHVYGANSLIARLSRMVMGTEPDPVVPEVNRSVLLTYEKVEIPDTSPPKYRIYVRVSYDGGASWESRGGQVPGVENALGMVSLGSGRVLMDTYNGIYETHDFGLSWTYLGAGNLAYTENALATITDLEPDEPIRLMRGDDRVRPPVIEYSDDLGRNWSAALPVSGIENVNAAEVSALWMSYLGNGRAAAYIWTPLSTSPASMYEAIVVTKPGTGFTGGEWYIASQRNATVNDWPVPNLEGSWTSFITMGAVTSNDLLIDAVR